MLKKQYLPYVSPSDDKQNRKKLLLRLFFTLIFYITLFLMTFSDFLNVNYEVENRSQVEIGGMTGLMFAYVLAVIPAWILDKEFRQLLLSKTGLIYGLVVFYLTLIGCGVFGNSFLWVKADLSVFLWPIGGFALFRILAKTYRPKLQLASLLIVLTVYVFTAVTQQALLLTITSAGQAERVIDWSVWNYASLLLVITGISFGLLCRQSRLLTILTFGSVIVQLYTLGFLGATRSSTLSVIAVLIFSSFGLSNRISDGVLQANLSVQRTKKIIYFLSTVCFIVLIAFIFTDLTRWLSSQTNDVLILERFFSPDQLTRQSSNLRIEEAINGLSSLSDIELIFGGGLGGSFKSVLGYEINAFHIGILTFILKGGFVLFGFVSFFLYINLPIVFIKSLLKPDHFTPLKRSALLTVLPGIFGMAILLLISGGYSSFSALGVGFAYGTYLQIKNDGLRLFFD